ncbi:type IV pilus twitching motility protein PilT [Enterococcus plantarum]|uniref:type IV pilus twitching motility protein PilT n=1 Tax=Enterococcus plantarum TaxID=1077675 RepID=UPI001A8FF749|nr:type IV pilus twitching motility protein PilT [Enterococcus plantarum]MBO0423633.1 type IV pilus twitching motility protein PilT [Enterococcus plantarum]
MHEEEIEILAQQAARRREERPGKINPKLRPYKEEFDALLRESVRKKVSDIHLTVGLSPVFRLNGELVEVTTEDVLTNKTISMYGRVMCNGEQWAEFKSNGEVDLAYEVKNASRFRVNIFRQKGNVSIALRIIATKIPELGLLGVPSVLKTMIQKKQGLFLVTGPTGSGKSTTLASMIDYLNRTKKTHIITLEDPIEYVHNHKMSVIDQREIGVDTESFANGLRASLRQDPDIILVGELRDFDTISIALTAAETGHLVLGTLHTTSAAATIERIVDVFSPEQQSQVRTQLAGALVGILAQRLLPNRGNNGRVAATEMLVNNKSIANLIRGNKTHQIGNMLQTGKSDGMYTMESCLQQLMSSGKVDIEAAEALLGEEE